MFNPIPHSCRRSRGLSVPIAGNTSVHGLAGDLRGNGIEPSQNHSPSLLACPLDPTNQHPRRNTKEEAILTKKTERFEIGYLNHGHIVCSVANGQHLSVETSFRQFHQRRLLDRCRTATQNTATTKNGWIIKIFNDHMWKLSGCILLCNSPG